MHSYTGKQSLMTVTVIFLLHLEGAVGWHNGNMFSSHSIRHTIRLSEYFYFRHNHQHRNCSFLHKYGIWTSSNGCQSTRLMKVK